MNTLLLNRETKSEINYDYILEHRIKYGKYSLISTLSAVMAIMLDGIEIVVVSIILPIMEKEFRMENTEKIILTQTIFIGEVIGSAIGGYIGDKYGRRTTLIFAVMLSMVFGFLSSFSNGAFSFIALRIFVAIGVGMIITICAT